MARGDQFAAVSVSEQTGKTVHDYENDTFAVALCSNTAAAAANFTNISQFTKVTGGSYADQPNNPTWTRAGDVSTLQAANVGFAQDAAGPEDIRTAVLFNTQAGVVGNDDVVTVVDLTTDGTTPISLRTGAININFGSSPTLVNQRQ